MLYIITSASTPIAMLLDAGSPAMVHVSRYAPYGVVMSYENADDWQRAKNEMQRARDDFLAKERAAIDEVVRRRTEH